MNKKILVVEDSRAFRNYLELQLTQAGYTTFGAETISEAKEILEKEPELLCAVLDYCLPDGQDGEVIDFVLSKNQKVIVLTAMFQEQIREEVLAKGVLDYILKDSMASVTYLLPLIQRLTNNAKHKALVVDDSRLVRRHVVQLLEHQYIKTLQAENGQEALDILKENPDITFVISDHDMPEKDGISMTKAIRVHHNKSELAVLGLSGSHDKTITARFLKAGANDFLHKPFNQEEFFCRIHQILDMKEATNELYRMANQDALTTLWNRRYLFDNCSSEKDCHLIAMIDIDHFKRVNDTYGHDGGDQALIAVAKVIKENFPDDIVARFGGEEFCIHTESCADAFITQLERLRTDVENLVIHHQDQEIKITISIGVSTDSGSLNEQIKLADDRLYVAKEQGRNQIVSQ